MMGMKTLSKGVKVEVTDTDVKVDLALNLEFEANILKVSGIVQDKVKAAIENMTGYEVKFVDVHIQGVARRPKSELEESLEKMDAAHENFFGEE